MLSTLEVFETNIKNLIHVEFRPFRQLINFAITNLRLKFLNGPMLVELTLLQLIHVCDII